MKIQDSSISMVSHHTYLERYEQSESLQMWVGNARPNTGNRMPEPAMSNNANKLGDYILELSDQTKNAQPVDQSDEPLLDLTEEDKLKIQLIEKFVENLTGKKIKIKIGVKIKERENECAELENSIRKIEAGRNPQTNRQLQGWGLEYDYHELSYEYEKTTFSAEGVIKTSDGKEITFNIDVSMTREFMQEQNIRIRSGDARIDPLVINYGGTTARLTDNKFSFDLDSDGLEDQISFLAPGSGFLALDINEDGVINNGSELFGPNTGNGFTELALHDHDSNEWIDENDSIFSRLRIWSKDAAGNDCLFALAEKGIGAIYLGNINTPFSLKNNENVSQGVVNRTGIYVKEEGTIGTVQQIDLSV